MKKIMFDDRFGLTKAVLDSTKTMTRRIVPQSLLDRVEPYQQEYYEGTLDTITEQDAILNMVTGERMFKTAYQLGEIVAVAQSYKDLGYTKEWVEQHISPNPNAKPTDPFEKKYPGWNNKMFVISGLMPHHIRITDIKVERLQDITDVEILKEGIQEVYPYIDRNSEDKVRTFQYLKDGKIRHRISPASLCFSYFIDDVCGKGAWKRNPYVFTYTFERVK